MFIKVVSQIPNPATKFVVLYGPQKLAILPLIFKNSSDSLFCIILMICVFAHDI